MESNMKNKIIVAQIMGKWLGGGVESVVMNYYRNIDRNKIQFDFICDSDSTNIPYKEIEKLGGKVILVPPYQKIIEYNKELKKIFLKNNYKIVHSHITTLNVFPLRIAKKCGVPIRIAHSHSTTNKKEWKKNIIKQLLRPFSRVYANNYMCCSELAGRWLFGNKCYDSGKVYLLNNAIDLEKFTYNEKIKNEKRKELGIDEDTIVIGHIGRFTQAKNHVFLIDIFNEIHKQKKNSILLLVGQGALENKIRTKIERLGLKDKVIFLGQRTDVNELYQAMDIFVLPSLYEGLPVVAMEAQTAGLLTIMSTEITTEAKIINSTVFLSLNKSEKEWALEILKLNEGFKRKNTEEEISSKDFNIINEGKKLEKKYITYMEKIRI